MAKAKLTDTEWLAQEAARVEGVLRQALSGSAGKPGINAGTLKAAVEYALGTDFYTNDDLTAIQAKLVADGIIEIV